MQLLQTDVNNKNMTKNYLLSSHDKHDAVTVNVSVFLFVSSITTQQFNKYTTDQ